jgi:hypothetical protein
MNVKQWEAEVTAKTKEFMEMRDCGDLTDAEFEELVQDLLDVSRISADLQLEENKIMIAKAVQGVKLLAGLA